MVASSLADQFAGYCPRVKAFNWLKKLGRFNASDDFCRPADPVGVIWGISMRFDRGIAASDFSKRIRCWRLSSRTLDFCACA
jgi:hypothetical protein